MRTIGVTEAGTAENAVVRRNAELRHVRAKPRFVVQNIELVDPAGADSQRMGGKEHVAKHKGAIQRCVARRKRRVIPKLIKNSYCIDFQNVLS